MASGLRKLVIPVAGLGTRGLPYTKEVPKEFMPVLETPTIHIIVEEAIQAGVDQIVFVTGRGKQALDDYFDLSPGLESQLRARGKHQLADMVHGVGSLCEVISVRQKEAKGLGHAVLCAKSIVGTEPFAVCLGDEIFPSWGRSPGGFRGIGYLCEAYKATGTSTVGVMEVPRSESPLYGMVDLGGASLGSVPGEGTEVVRRAVEKPKPDQSPSNYAVIGRYVFSAEIMDILKDLPPGVGGEIQLTDAMNVLAQNGKLRAMMLPGPRYDVGTPLQYVLAQVDAALARPELADRLRTALKSRLP
jgi:UTP--glucose-1-phosphate uridylyltransferase